MLIQVLWSLVFWVLSGFFGFAFLQLKKSQWPALLFGLTIGAAMGALSAFPLTLVNGSWSPWAGLMALAGGTGVGALLYPNLTNNEHRTELDQQIKLVGELKAKLAEGRNDHFILDESALYFGDVVQLINAVYFSAEFSVPRFAVTLVQGMATHQDTLIQAQGEFAIRTLERLQKDSALPVRILEKSPLPEADYASQLEALLKAEQPAILISANAAIVRAVRKQGLNCVYLPDLRDFVSPNYFPAQRLQVHIVEAGQESGQGIAYLPDGTRVVVEGGGVFIGRSVEIQLQQIYDTVSGQMVTGTVSA